MIGLIRHQFIRFVLVGCINTGFSYGLYALFLWSGLNFAVANGLAFVISLFFSFRTQGTLVFRNPNAKLLVRFVMIWSVVYVLNIALISGLMRAGMSAYLAGAVALVPITLMSYLLQKFAVFGASTRPAAADATQSTP